MFNSKPVTVLCDFCGEPIIGDLTNVGTSMEVILSCKKCLGEYRDEWDRPLDQKEDEGSVR